MAFRLLDKNINRLETSEGVLTMKSLFFPYFIEMVLINMIGTVNTIFLSHSSDQAVAAVGAASQLIGMVLTFYGVVSSGASIIISQNLGAGKKDKASHAAVISIIFSAVLSLFIGTTLAVFAESILTRMHLKADVLIQSASYFRICIFFSFIQAITSALSGILRSYGRPKTAVKVSIFVNIINALFCYLVVFRPFETPLHGVQGIAAGSVISQLCGMILMIILFIRASLGIHFHKGILSQLNIIATILRVGIPGGITSLSYSLSQVVSTSIIATLGTTAITTKIYLENIFYYVYVLGLALGLSTSIMVGRLVGARKYDQAYELNKQNLKITIFCNFLFSLAIYLLGGYIIRLFTDNPEIIHMARIIMLIDLLVEIGRGFNHIEGNSLRGAGDVVFPMTVSIASCWVVSILFSYILGIKLGLGLFGCWMAFAMDELFRGTLFFLRWNSRRWTTKGLV
ncbi:MAG TPA: MATE family efflux transporter [Mobilitalea sp.]|nr:MATE family efflux transporter [Mobilitalea sp.]